jgi:Uncharacterised nucleotidyltransferase
MPLRRKERDLLAACFHSRAETSLLPGLNGDWESLIRAAAEEFVLPGLYCRLGEIQWLDQVPSEISHFLSAVERLNLERNERILDEARAIAELLNGIGVEPVFLKGAAYALEGIYPKPGCRYLYDLDLLVPVSRLVEAAEALEREGYRQDTLDSMARFRHHHPQLQRPRILDGSGSGPVELHHSLGHGGARRLLSGAEVLRESRRLEWRGVRVRLPSPEHLVTHLILHSQIHHSYSDRIWPPMRAMYDLALINRHYAAELNWGAVRERFRAHGEESTLLLHLLQVEETLGMQAPFAIGLRPAMGARWRRRQALNRWPALRFIDPIYLALATLSRRWRFLQSIVLSPGGWKHAFRMLLRPDFYRRLLDEISL